MSKWYSFSFIALWETVLVNQECVHYVRHWRSIHLSLHWEWKLVHERVLYLNLDFQCTCNNIGDSGACSFSSALKINSTLTSFDLRVPLIKWEKWHSFSFIDFVRNSIGESGMCSLSSGLEVNSTVTSVRLEECFYIKGNLLHFWSEFVLIT